jgi:predicted DsbA family dithiol-disulfide isomerase
VNWCYFSLEQVNSQYGPQWKIWEQPEGYASRGLPAFRAAEAARRQGEDAFGRFHMTLLRAKHKAGQDITNINTLTEVAHQVGLEISRFQNDLTDRKLLSRLAENHTFAVENLGVFGTPTLVFSQKQAIFLKMPAPPPPEECLQVFNELRHLAIQRHYIREIKRPSK